MSSTIRSGFRVSAAATSARPSFTCPTMSQSPAPATSRTRRASTRDRPPAGLEVASSGLLYPEPRAQRPTPVPASPSQRSNPAAAPPMRNRHWRPIAAFGLDGRRCRPCRAVRFKAPGRRAQATGRAPLATQLSSAVIESVNVRWTTCAGTLASTRVPSPGLEWTATLPPTPSSRSDMLTRPRPLPHARFHVEPGAVVDDGHRELVRGPAQIERDRRAPLYLSAFWRASCATRKRHRVSSCGSADGTPS